MSTQQARAAELARRDHEVKVAELAASPVATARQLLALEDALRKVEAVAAARGLKDVLAPIAEARRASLHYG